MAALAVSGSPMISSVPTACVTFAPCNTAPRKPSTPTTSPARITEMALAPTAGANGVEPDDPAPMAHAMNRLAAAAKTNVASVVTPGMVPRVAVSHSWGAPTSSLSPVLIPLAESQHGPAQEEIAEEHKEQQHRHHPEPDGIGQKFGNGHSRPSAGRPKVVSTECSRPATVNEPWRQPATRRVGGW